ncbi:hypothetical protein Ciccas_007214 [Cichlidogyrus casuarinus]|uniref:Uncharacterized protein n=1 Tax=Cichlidogyrus casuarinus TaxID=1844966 RepID=A0ABD2Q3G3_9PLAT
MLACTKILLAGLNDAVDYRTRHMTSMRETIFSNWQSKTGDKNPQSPNDVIGYYPCWISDCQPHGVGDLLLRQFNSLVEVITGNSNVGDISCPGNELTELMSITLDLASVLLRAAKSRLDWLNSCDFAMAPVTDPASVEMKAFVQHVQRAKRLFAWFAKLRCYLINTIAEQLHRPELAFNLAIQYADREQILAQSVILSPQFNKANRAQDPVRIDNYLLAAISELPPSLDLPKFALAVRLLLSH